MVYKNYKPKEFTFMYTFKYHYMNNLTIGPNESFFCFVLFSPPENSSEHFLSFRNSESEYVVGLLNL